MTTALSKAALHMFMRLRARKEAAAMGTETASESGREKKTLALFFVSVALDGSGFESVYGMNSWFLPIKKI